MVDIGEGVVGFSQSVLDSLKGAKVISIIAVLVSVTFPPGLIEDRHGADVFRSDSVDESDGMRKGVVVHLAVWKAWLLALILHYDRIPVTAIDFPYAICCMVLKILSTRIDTLYIGIVPGSTRKVSHFLTEAIAVTVTKEENIFISSALTLLARIREARNTGVRAHCA